VRVKVARKMLVKWTPEANLAKLSLSDWVKHSVEVIAINLGVASFFRDWPVQTQDDKAFFSTRSGANPININSVLKYYVRGNCLDAPT